MSKPEKITSAEEIFKEIQKPHQMRTEEIKKELGAFGKEFEEHWKGDIVRDDIFGTIKDGWRDYAVSIGAISLKKVGDSVYSCVNPERFSLLQRKMSLFAELNGRREYAKNKELEDIETTMQQVGMV